METNLDYLKSPMWRENEGETFIDVFMCATDWECEIGGAAGGNRVYPSIEDLKECARCWSACGIVKVRVSFLEVVEPPKEYE